eukprot:CAMPEP_0176436722 /NCGR_PEP_ID=MMETSP0127-20121128/18151_1 /TAXON_ID=938130 /ORGANISM="Platyophrya macrostoma, Strain WH" /LENGTH=887 /DNA_ID=CAMNT_0017820123 /DNA_START=41 /DNA_END=2704 /DNA_ORIENTATION=-
MAHPAFKGTLLLLQNRTRRDPDSYREEFKAQLEHFDALTKAIAANPQQQCNPQYIAVLSYVCHVAHCYPAECRHVADVLIRTLRSTKGSLDQETRLSLAKNLMLLRSKDLVGPEDSLPVLFELLQMRDKTLRKAILSHIVGDIRKANLPSSKNGPAVNKKAQSFLFHVMKEDDPVQARCAMMLMIDLYRRNVWADERTVQVLTTACFSRHTAILRTALRFFLLQMPKIAAMEEESDEDENDPGRVISKLKQKLKIVKKTKYRERVLDRRMKDSLRKYNKELKAEEALAKAHVDPIRLLRDPHQFAEQLLTKLQKTTERFEVRLLYLNVLARVVSEHEVVMLQLYSFLERYMEPSQLHSTQLLALAASCVHRMVPPDAVEPLLQAIANHFVSDRSTPDAITIGINTIREICKRQPLAMNPTLLSDLVEYKNQRGDRGVMMAARSLIQLYRDINPELLPAKLRSGRAGAPATGVAPRFGASTPLNDIPGLELLLGAGDEQLGDDIEDRGSDASGSQIHISDSDSDDSGSWELASDDDDDLEELLGDDENFVDVSNSDDDDEVPQLVPLKTASLPPKKQQPTPPDNEEEDDDIWLEEDDSVVATVNKSKAKKEAAGAPPKKVARTEEAAKKKAPSSDEDDVDSDEEEGEDSSEEWEEGDEDEEGDDDSDEGSWKSVSQDSDEDDESDVPKDISISEAVAAAPPTDWYVDVDRHSNSSKGTLASSKATKASTTASNVSVAATRFLTDEDFEKIRKLREQHGDHRTLRGKLKDREERAQKRHQLIHGVSADLQAHDIEAFTVKKRAQDRDDKITKAQELRSASSKFEIRKKTKAKLHSTHGEHSKRGKLFQMTKRSQRVAEKLKRSVEDRQDRKKDMKKKDVKFRIKRGWKA